MVDEDTKNQAKPFVPYRPFNSIKECYDEMAKHHPFGLLTNGKEYVQVVEVFEGTFNTCYIVILEEKILVNLTFTYAFNNYQFIDGSKFGVEDNDLGVKIIETYSVQIRKLSAVLPLVKTVKDALHISLKEAKDIVDNARGTNGRIDNLSKEAAEKMAANINYWKGEAIIIAKEQSL